MSAANLIRRLERLGRPAMQKAEHKLAQRLYKIHSEAVQAAPLDLGKLRQSIQVRIEEGRRSGFVTAGNINDNSKNYAAFVEFGTGTKVQVPKGFEKMAIRFKGRVRIKSMRAMPYLIPAFLRHKRLFVDDIRKIIADEVGRP